MQDNACVHNRNYELMWQMLNQEVTRVNQVLIIQKSKTKFLKLQNIVLKTFMAFLSPTD